MRNRDEAMRAVEGFDHTKANELSDHMYKVCVYVAVCISVLGSSWATDDRVCRPAVEAISLKQLTGPPSDPFRLEHIVPSQLRLPYPSYPRPHFLLCFSQD